MRQVFFNYRFEVTAFEFRVTYSSLLLLFSIVTSFFIYLLKGNRREKYSESSFSFRYLCIKATPKKLNVQTAVLSQTSHSHAKPQRDYAKAYLTELHLLELAWLVSSLEDQHVVLLMVKTETTFMAS